MSDCDVLVVGGGPAGSSLAAMAAERGARVVLVEREAFPRDKVCGEFLSAEGCEVLRDLGILAPLLEAGAGWIDTCRLTDRKGRSIEADLPRGSDLGPALGVSRELLDTTLLALAGRRGVSILSRSEAVGPIVEGGRAVGARIRPVGGVGDERDVRARIVVAADGRRSCILRAFDPRSGDPSRTTSRSWFGLKLHLASAAPPFGRVELHIFDGGYAGVAAVEGDRINLCLLVRVAALRACGGSPDRLLRERILANPAARDLLERATPCGEWKSIGPLRFGVRRAVAGGAFLVGDAAGTVDPFSGEGMANALQGARLALPFVLEAAANGGMDARLAREYRKAWTSEFRPVTRRVRGLGFLFGHPGLFAATLAALSGPAKRLLPCIVASTRTELPRARR